MVNQVIPAEPFRDGQMGSFGGARYMLLTQYKFPDTYADNKKTASSDHDRMIMWDREKWKEIIDKYEPVMAGGFHHWLIHGSKKDLFNFTKDVMMIGNEPGGMTATTKWTGFRILGTVNPSGYPIYSFQLFAKARGSKTKVYSGMMAPNVKGYKEVRRYTNRFDLSDPYSPFGPYGKKHFGDWED